MDYRPAFLRAHPPFDTLDNAAVEAVAAAAESRAHAAGAGIVAPATAARPRSRT